MYGNYGPSKSLIAINEGPASHLRSKPAPDPNGRKPAPLPRIGSEGSNLSGEANSGYGHISGAAQSHVYANQYSPKTTGNDPNQSKNTKRTGKKQLGKVKETVGVYENWTAILSYQSTKKHELTLKKGQPVQVLSKDKGGWWFGQADNRLGMFPSIYVAHKSSNNSGKFSIRPLEIDKSELKECEVIGIGGFGRVYRGIWRREEVALKKVIREVRESDDSARERVRREGKLLCLLHHPNIIRLRGVCLQEPSMCLVMEYARGGSLFKVLRGQKLTLDVIINWAIQIAKGMLYLHEEVQQSFRLTPIIHRDLKSHNILIYESTEGDDLLNNTLKITDFGQARQVTQTARMSNAGTYAWAAPESIRDRQFSKYSDVWSYGVVLWEMLTGEVPYNGYEPLQILYAVGSFRRLPIPEKCPRVFQTLLKACWEEVPEQRPLFSDVLSILEDIKESPLVTRNMASFKSLQVQWHQEIQEKLEKLRARDDELNERADAINQLLQKQQNQEESLNRREQEFFLRELELFEREITIMIREQNFDQMQNALTKKKRWFSVPNIFKKLEISKPRDVVHITKVTKVTTADNRPDRYKITRKQGSSPGTPYSEVSSPTDISSASPSSPQAVVQPKRKIKTILKSPKSPTPQALGKTIWYKPLEQENEKLADAAAASLPEVRCIDEHTEVRLHQGTVGMPQPSIQNVAAVDATTSLIISRKPTIDHDPRKFEENLFHKSISNEMPRQETNAKRPSTLSIAGSNNASSGPTLSRNPSHAVYQWGTMSCIIDSAPGKTTVVIGSTPTSAAYNPVTLDAFSFQNGPTDPLSSSTLSPTKTLQAAPMKSSQRIDSRTPTKKSVLTNFSSKRTTME